MHNENVFILDRLGGSGFLAAILGEAIEHFFGYEITILNSAQDVKFLLQTDEEYENSPLLYLSKSSSTTLDQEVFGLHCLLRNRCRSDYLTWVGGLIILPRNINATYELLTSPIYKNLSGHRVMSFPVGLLDLLTTVDQIGELYPGAWALAAEKTGLVDFWKSMNAVISSLDQGDNYSAVRYLTSAMNQVVQDGVLKRLLPHQEVVRRMESLLPQLAEGLCPTTDRLYNLHDDINQVMSDYQL